MKIDILNPNSSSDITRSMAECLTSFARADCVLHCTELRNAPAGIETDDDVAAVTPMVAQYAENCDADVLVVACFSDPGVAEIRRLRPRGVIGIAEAAYYAALPLAPKFGVISLGPASVRRHADHIARLGLENRLAGDRSLGLSVAKAHAPEALDHMIRLGHRLIHEDGAKALLLGCAGMGSKRADLETTLGVPVIDPVQAAVAQAQGWATLGWTLQGR